MIDPNEPETKVKIEEYCAEVFTQDFIDKLIILNKYQITDDEIPIEALIEEAKHE